MGMTIEDAVRQSNRLLAALPLEDWQDLKLHLELVDLRADQVLCEPGRPLAETHFPLTGTLVSVLVILCDGKAFEAATIGREGVVGGGIVSDPEHPSFAKAVAQIPGRSVRIATSRLQKAKERSAKLRDLFARYADALLAQALQSVVCNAFHPMQQRFARWLLISQDRVDSNELPLTQEYLARMLGAHRSTVIRVARPLQEGGVIRYSRGRITILNRAKLEKAACECNAAVVRHFERVLPPPETQRGRTTKGAGKQRRRVEK
jgi:CRP-like cAMP-binding protein